MLFAFALLLPGLAGGYVRSVVPETETCLFWNLRDLGWSMQEDGARSLGRNRSLDTIRSSFDTWGELACSDIRFVEGPLATSRETGYFRHGGNTNLLLFRSVGCDEVVSPDAPCLEEGGCANLLDCWDFDPGVIAVTTTTFRENTGEILDADIQFNEAHFDFTAMEGPPCATSPSPSCIATDLQNTATHEIGHFLGLDHVDDPEATMFASAADGETFKRVLSEDERLAVCDIYPAGEPTWVCSTPSGLREVGATDDGCGCSGGQGGGGLFASLLLLSLFVLRRSLLRGVSG